MLLRLRLNTYSHALCLGFDKFTLCSLVESGDMGRRQAGVHSERREGQPRLETLDQWRQTLLGRFNDICQLSAANQTKWA